MNRKISSKISSIITIILLVSATIFVYHTYRVNNFNDFKRSERTIGLSKFKRDKDVKYSESDSYEIISNDYNDAMFCKAVKVKENTPYKVTCMVKTENIEKEEENSAIRSTNFNE